MFLLLDCCGPWLLSSNHDLKENPRATRHSNNVLVIHMFLPQLQSMSLASSLRKALLSHSSSRLCIFLLLLFRLFWSERKVEKARSWLNRSVTTDPKYGDSWAHLLKLEQQYGTAEQQQDVVRRAVEAAPKYGPLWCSVSKAVGSSRLNLDEILLRVADKIQFTW